MMYSKLSGKEINYKSLVTNDDDVIRYHLYTIHYTPATANIVWILFYIRQKRYQQVIWNITSSSVRYVMAVALT